MLSIIKAAGARAAQAVPFQLDDMARQAGQHLDQARAQAAEIIEQADAEADAIRLAAQEEGRADAVRAAEQAVDEKIGRRLETLLPALRQAVDAIDQGRQDWLAHWESGALRLAIAIAERVIRRELKSTPEITLDLVKEALELAAGSGDVQVRLHPDDFATLGPQARRLSSEIGRLGNAQVIADPKISRGGCRVDSRFGSIDQQLEVQLARIAEELGEGK